MEILKKYSKKILIGLISIVLIFVLVAIVFTFSDKRTQEENVKGESSLRSIDFEHKNTLEKYNANFEIKAVKESNVKSASIDQIDPIETETPQQQKVKTPALPINTLSIPKLNLNTKVLGGIDGELAIHEGAWLYPNSYEGEGEKILLGHRRFWGADDPRSFWNLDQLKEGDAIHYADANGVIYNYAVKSVAVRNAGDLSTLKPSKENIIKVISCSTADGTAGSSEKRIVVIATQI